MAETNTGLILEQIVKMSHITTIQLLQTKVSKEISSYHDLSEWSIEELQSLRDELVTAYNLIYKKD